MTDGKKWSPQQLAIFGWFLALDVLGVANLGRNLVVRARAGTGKTTTIIEAIRQLSAVAPALSVCLCAFNKRIAEELTVRLGSLPNACAKTLHSLGFACVLPNWRGVKVDSNRGRRLAEQACAARSSFDATPKAVLKAVAKLASLAKNTHPLDYAAPGVLLRLGADFEIFPVDSEDCGNWTDADICDATVFAVRLATQQDGTVDFDDMLFVPLALNLVRAKFDVLLVDEGQDMNAAQLMIARRLVRKPGSMVVVGDDRQCQPAGTMVRLADGRELPIEQIKVGDVVSTFDRHSGAILQNGAVTETSQRPYASTLFSVTANNKTTRCTDSHKWLVRWTDRTTEAWATYLMRQGGRYRVGQCRLFRKLPSSTGGLNFGLGDRARVERADAAWILKTHDSLAGALAYEQIVSARYGLPEMVFHQPSGVKHFTQATIDVVYTALGDLTANATRCLSDHGRSIEYPIYAKAIRQRQGRRTLFETQACNLIPGFMAVPVPTGGKGIEWCPVEVTRSAYAGVVFSLNVAKHHKYVADGLVTCNCIYGFRGADTTAFDRLKTDLTAEELPLTVTYRCGKAIVAKAKLLVPDFEAAEGNPEGLVTQLKADKLQSAVAPGNFVLSRKNAPLMAICLSLLKAGVRAKIVGRDIGETLAALVRKCGKDGTVEGLLTGIDKWAEKEMANAVRTENEARATEAGDKAEVLRMLAEEADTVDAVLAKIETLFADLIAGQPIKSVVLSSIHKAKGLEADKVFVLTDTLYPGKNGRAKVEECNLEYVAVSRAVNHLVLVAP